MAPIPYMNLLISVCVGPSRVKLNIAYVEACRSAILNFRHFKKLEMSCQCSCHAIYMVDAPAAQRENNIDI